MAAVRKYVPAAGTLLIAGHSQGVALAALTHAFLFNAMNAADGSDPFQLAAKKYQLRSYTFAQPRAGNLHFALNFARITSGGATSCALNNTIDPVTMVPTTHSFIAGAFEDSPNQHGWKVLRWINTGLNQLHNLWNAMLEKGLARELRGVKTSKLADYQVDSESWGPVDRPAGPVSQNYVTSGTMIPLIGHTNQDILLYYNFAPDESDEFVQHHATTHRRLLEELFHLEATSDEYMANQQPVRDQ